MHFLLWAKWSHVSTNFDTSKCSDENLPNSLCHFPNYKPVFLQILHDSSVPLKITPLYFFWPNVIYFEQKGQITVQILETWVLGSKFTKFLSFLKQQIGFSSNFVSLFSILRHNSLAEILYIFNKRRLSKCKFGEIWWAAKSLKFSTLMGSCCKNHLKF